MLQWYIVRICETGNEKKRDELKRTEKMIYDRVGLVFYQAMSSVNQLTIIL